MEKSLTELKQSNEDHYSKGDQPILMCTNCKGTFQKPILATVSSAGWAQTYHACPLCLSKISDVKQDRGEEDKQTSMSMNPVSKVAVRRGEDVKCRHFLGYLKKRPKDMQIPDECLTCDKMIQCLLK